MEIEKIKIIVLKHKYAYVLYILLSYKISKIILYTILGFLNNNIIGQGDIVQRFRYMNILLKYIITNICFNNTIFFFG